MNDSQQTIGRTLKNFASIMAQLSLAVTLFCLFCFLSVDGKPFDAVPEATCGYEACPSAGLDTFNVHVVPHSHDDVGWLKTYDQYYFQDVQNVISSVVVALKQNPERRFVQVETAFFKKWWEQQKDSIKQDVINLVNNGQFEIINGAWSMNDEAAVHYHSTIDQFTFGLRYLEDNLGPCSRPRVAWQIDPFGHSREQASISAQMGFDSMFFARLDYRDKNTRMDKKTMDLLWRATANLGNTSDIFTSALYHHYSAPSGFCFDIVCNDDPIIDDEESPDYNYQKRVEDFAAWSRDQASRYPTDNILITMGDDFRYQAALTTYINLDRLIKGFDLFPQEINGKPVKVMYSTPSCYTKAVNEFVNSNNVQLEVKTDDFMPYADGPNTYWTGYFTSRPASKHFERQGNNLLQVVKQLAAVSKRDYYNENISSLKDAMGVMQHHDAITGTEKQHVAHNYHLLLSSAMKRASDEASLILTSLISGDASVEDFEFKSCLLSNVSSCAESNSDKFTVVVYNPLPRPETSTISIPVNSENWRILDRDSQEIEYQITPTVYDFSYMDDVEILPYTLEFSAVYVPAVGFNVYQFEKTTKKLLPPPVVDEASVNIGYLDTSFELDAATGLLKTVTMLGVTMDVKQDLLYYTSQDSSGAYIFVPTDTNPQRVASGPVKTTAISGYTYQGVIQEFAPWAKQIIKVYNDDRHFVEIDWIIGPIDIGDGPGKEIISQFTTPLDTKGVFYTDSNGREMIKRTRNYRPTYDYSDEQPISGNYYPVNSKILIRDEQQALELAVLTDRSEGGGSINDGQLEIMIHRACHHDDGRGVGESLNEQEYGQGIVVRGKHYLIMGPTSGTGVTSLAGIERIIAQKKVLAPWTFITKKDISANLKNLLYYAVKLPFPDNVNILTLEPWSENKILIRLEHILEKDEDPSLSQDASVDISDLFFAMTITALEEKTLGANLDIAETARLQWPGSEESPDDSPALNVQARAKRDLDDMRITLAPMQIRTFIATVEYN